MTILSAIGDADNRDAFETVRPPSEIHPATRLLADTQRLDIDRAHVYRRFMFDLASGRDISFMLEVQHGEPLVIEKALGKGRSIVQGVPLGISWSNLPLCQFYVAMLQEWLWYLSEPTFPNRNLNVGELIQLEQTEIEPGRTYQVRRPDGTNEEVHPVGRPTDRSVQHPAVQPGLYELAVTEQDSQVYTSTFWVHRDAEESNLESVTDRDLTTLNDLEGFQLGTGALALPEDRTLVIPTTPLERWLLIGLVVFLFSELAFAGWTTHRRHLPVKPVVLES